MKLHIANLSPKVTETCLRQLFGQYGLVQSLELKWTQSPDHTGGTAIIEMLLTDALTAARELNARPFRNRRLYITLMGKEVRPSSPSLRPGHAVDIII